MQVGAEQGYVGSETRGVVEEPRQFHKRAGKKGECVETINSCSRGYSVMWRRKIEFSRKHSALHCACRNVTVLAVTLVTAVRERAAARL